MEKYILNFKQPVESIRAVIKSAERFSAVIKGVEYVNAVIKNLPNRFYISPECRTVLFSSMVASLFKQIEVIENEMQFRGATKEVAVNKFASVDHSKAALTSQSSADLSKYVMLHKNNMTLSNTSISAALARYRKLSEMDTDGMNELTFQDFDDMTLGEIDWYEV